MFKQEQAKVIAEDRIPESKPESLTKFFHKKSERLQKKIKNKPDTISRYSLYPQKMIADQLNISREMLRKKIYGEKPLTRDWLIAICGAYGLDAEETNEALKIGKMPKLDIDCTRDYFIMNYLKKHKYEPIVASDFC